MMTLILGFIPEAGIESENPYTCLRKLCPPSTQFKVSENPAVLYKSRAQCSWHFSACKRHHGRECDGMSLDFQTIFHSFGCSRPKQFAWNLQDPIVSVTDASKGCHARRKARAR